MGREEAIQIYRQLLLARCVEERIRQEYAKDDMKTPVHLGIGQEAIPIGVCHCLPPGATTFGTYRNHALYLAVTGETDALFGELYGKATGVAKGKAGSMHLSAPDRGLLATSAVVGTTIPLAVGAAFANAYRKSPDPVAVFFGDGAVEEGVFWESLNFACLRGLRLLFVCEDNDLAIHTPTRERRGFSSLTEILRGFNCHVMQGDGSDLLSVITLARSMIKFMKEQPKPGVLHLSYFRFLEHVGPNEDFDAGYRRQPTGEERERLDPVLRFEQALSEDGIEASVLRAVRVSVQEQIDRSIRAAREAPFPPAAELHQDVHS